MKKYNVTNQIDTPDMFNGAEPHDTIRYDVTHDGYVVAENENEAISIVKDYIRDNINRDYYVEEKEDEIVIYDFNDEVVESHYNFKAKEIVD